jgi:Tol biopolymer transport system component
VVLKGGVNESPVWTPDGTHALFTSNRSGSFGLWTIPMQNGEPSGTARLVKGDIGRVFVMGLTSSGTLFYRHQEGVNNNYVAGLDPATGKVRGSAKMISENFVGSNGFGAWSPDGGSFAFLRSPLGLGGNYLLRGNFPFDLVIHSMETGEERSYPSAQLSTKVTPPYWLPNSSGVLVPTHEPTGNRWVVHSINAKTGETNVAMQTEIRFPNTSPVPAPDGKALYFPDFQNADNLPLGLFAVDVATDQRRQIYHTPAGSGINGRALFVSPDNKKIAFELRRQKDAPWELCTISADGSGFRGVYTPEPGQVFPGPLRGATWSPDSRWIFFTVDVDKGANSRLMRIPAEGGQPEFTGLELPRMNRLALSPDGTHVAFSSADVAQQEFWALDNLLPALKSTR